VPAYCGLADMHTIEHIAHPGRVPSQHAGNKELWSLRARRSSSTPPTSTPIVAWPGAHAMMKQYGQAELHMQVASELNPHDSWTAISAALLFAFCGQYQRASELSQVALDMTLSPSLTHWAYQADIQFLSGNYEAAVEGGPNRGPRRVVGRGGPGETAAPRASRPHGRSRHRGKAVFCPGSAPTGSAPCRATD